MIDLRSEHFRSLRVLSTAVAFNEVLARALFSVAGEGVLETFTFEQFVGLNVGNTFQCGNDVLATSCFETVSTTKRVEAHRIFAQQEPAVHKKLHHLLFNIASGYSPRYVHEVMPGYLRTSQAAAYHLAMVDADRALLYYQAMLSLAKDGGIEDNPFLPHRHLYLNWQLLTELKEGFGIFVDEPVTDELCELGKP